MQVDLVGGYYDAGDNVKFSFPMDFTTTMLEWSIIEFGRLMGDELQNAKSSIGWATYYFLKATTYTNTLYMQVFHQYHICTARFMEIWCMLVYFFCF